ncbi:MAG: hypothetical protein ACT6RL_18275 [Neoaquamicrobium sediminum]|uniref:hypothetical protein n=1 Tax=Neoaquamicrobium sediminum TaxID=1849104 RepID=UPI004035D586
MASAGHSANGRATHTDPAWSLSQAWIQAHAAMAEHCLRQQRLETELLECGQSSQNVDGKPARRAGGRGGIKRAYAKAKAAEALAAAREQELLERLPMTPAHSLAGIAAKLTVILTELEDNTDLTDFPAPHLRSALEDLKRLMGQANVDASLVSNSDQEIADDLYHA